IPRNSMEAPSKLAGGQAAQPSAAETKKAMRRWMKDTERQFKRLKADCAEFVKRSETSSKEMLDRLQNNLEQAREAKRLQEQKVEQQKLMINTLQQLLQLPFEMTEFGTGATGLPVHHPPEAPAIEESLGLLQSHLPQGLAHGNNVEQPDLTYDGDLPVSLSHLNNTDPSRTAMVSGSSPMQGSLAPQGQGNNSEQPASANDDQFPDNHPCVFYEDIGGSWMGRSGFGDLEGWRWVPFLLSGLTIDDCNMKKIEGDQNDQAVQPLAADQNNQSIQPSATEIKKANKRASDKKYRHGKKQKMENIQRQFEKLKADYAESVKREASSQLQLPFEMTEFGTGTTGLPVHHPPVYQSGDSAIAESLGLPQSHVPQGLAHGNNVEQPALTYDCDLSVSLNHLNNTYPPRTAMPWWSSSPMQGPLAPQGQARACLHFLYLGLQEPEN
ncbi:hypothetical protein H0E87_024081, partial [Populus deltoides]